MSHRVLVVDDDVEACDLLEVMLPRLGYTPRTVQSGEEALKALERAEFDTVLTDLAMPRMDGVELCRRVKAARPWLPVVLVTGHNEMRAALQTMRAGASDFLAKPLDDSSLIPCLARTSRLGSLNRALLDAKRTLAQSNANGLIGGCAPMQRIAEMVAHVAPSDASVLIGGETGTGKELVAKAIHEQSLRAWGPFVTVNCAAIPAALVESELFGHVKGAFTDASGSRDGLFVEASGGTLFLDEVGELPLEVQPKLLRALQQRTVRAVGSNAERPFDTRIITATNRDLDEEIAQRRFREDLYYRINVVRVDLPPLRDRGNDILAIALHILENAAPGEGLTLATDVVERLLSYTWPGNVRELENCLQGAVALARTTRIGLDDLPRKVRGLGRAGDFDFAQASEIVSMDELERRYIHHTLRVVDGNKTKAARLLGLDRRTLYRKLDRERDTAGPPASGARVIHRAGPFTA